MAQGLQSLSLIVAGQVIRGVCYASPDQFVGHQAPLSPIPPERMGLQGEYDHYGLAKRIQARFKDRLGRVAAAKVMVKQRGGAIILSGQVESPGMLEELIALAIKADGATQVEVYDMQVNSLAAVAHSAFQVA
jgi:osmotically-inducible protein OsmY